MQVESANYPVSCMLDPKLDCRITDCPLYPRAKYHFDQTLRAEQITPYNLLQKMKDTTSTLQYSAYLSLRVAASRLLNRTGSAKDCVYYPDSDISLTKPKR